jgi:hypothetical protein
MMTRQMTGQEGPVLLIGERPILRRCLIPPQESRLSLLAGPDWQTGLHRHRANLLNKEIMGVYLSYHPDSPDYGYLVTPWGVKDSMG